MNLISQIQETGVLPNKKPTGYSLSWQIGTIQGLKTVKHDGIVNGFTSMSIYIPEKNLFVTALSNCDCFRDIELPASKITAIIANKPFPTQSIELAKNQLEKFQGRYNNGNSEMIIAAHDSILMYYRPRGDKRELIPVGAKTFQIKGSLDQIAFQFKDGESNYTLRTLNTTTHWERTENISAYNSLSLDYKALEEYVGKYQVPNQFAFEVIRIGDTLYGQMGNDKKEIFSYATDKFCARNLDAFLEFTRDQQGKVIQLTFRQGREITAEKIK